MKKAIKKKATASVEFLAVVVIILVVALGLFILITKFITKATTNTDRDICRASVMAQSVAMQVNDDLIKPDCKTENVKFYQDRIEINGKDSSVYDATEKKFVKKFTNLDESKVNNVIAEQLRWCWYQFLEGKRSILESDFVFPSQLGQTCFVCSEISFDESVKKNSFSGFYQYTKDSKMPNSEKTYYQYYAEEPRLTSFLYRDATPNSWEAYAAGKVAGITFECKELKIAVPSRSAVQTDITFNKYETYAIIFVKEGTTRKTDIKSDPTDPCSSETYFSYVIPVKDIANQCGFVSRGKVK